MPRRLLKESENSSRKGVGAGSKEGEEGEKRSDEKQMKNQTESGR